MGFVVRSKVVPGETPPRCESAAAQVHEGAGCEDKYLHTPGGVEFARDGGTVFASREEAAEEARGLDDAAAKKEGTEK